MHQAKFVVRDPLLDPKHRVLGYRLTWQQTGAALSGAAELNALNAFSARQLNDEQTGWLLRDKLLFVDAAPALLSGAALLALPARKTVLSLKMADLAHSDTLMAVKALRKKGFGIMVRDADPRAFDRTLLFDITHIELQDGAADIAAQAKIYAAFKLPATRLVARQAGSWQQYEAWASLGLDAFVGKLTMSPQPRSQAKGINPTQKLILQLMDAVRKNADVRQLEELMKRDPALSYKLFRYINSVGFGLGAEILSLRHAVTLLGYTTLYRWLSLLLATASSGEYAALLMQAAIVRGRFAELLGRGLLSKSDAENLFVTGMFSLLDKLLGISMEELLGHIQLSDVMSQALLAREGMYGPFLALVEACELDSGRAGALADSLFLNARQVNEAHLAALAWMQGLEV